MDNKLKEVLKAVNEIRAERGYLPLDSIPRQDWSRGFGTSRTCPITVALNADYSSLRVIEWPDGTFIGPGLVPEVISAFIKDFDEGKYPELKSKKHRLHY